MQVHAIPVLRSSVLNLTENGVKVTPLVVLKKSRFIFGVLEVELYFKYQKKI